MRLDLIVEVSRRPAPEYRFRHGLVQEVAYGSLLEPARRSLHRRIGEALETLYGESNESVYGPIGRHFAEADEPERAARYLLLAGDAARAVYADHEAVEHYRRARTFLRRLGRSGARARHALQDRPRPAPGVRLRARRSGLRRRLRLLRRAPHRARARRPRGSISRSCGPIRTRRATRYSGESGDRDRAALPRAPAHRPRPQRRPRAGPEHERLGRRPDLPLHAARGRLLERRAPADRGRLRLRLAQAARGGARDGVPARRHRLGRGARRLDARGAPARAAQLLPVRARVALVVPLAAAPRRRGRRRVAPPRVARRQRPVHALLGRRRRRAPVRQPALAQRRRGNVGDVHVVFRERGDGAIARGVALGPLRPRARRRRTARRRARR